MQSGCICVPSVSGKQRAAFEPGNKIENARFFLFWSFFSAVKTRNMTELLFNNQFC